MKNTFSYTPCLMRNNHSLKCVFCMCEWWFIFCWLLLRSMLISALWQIVHDVPRHVLFLKFVLIAFLFMNWFFLLYIENAFPYLLKYIFLLILCCITIYHILGKYRSLFYDWVLSKSPDKCTSLPFSSELQTISWESVYLYSIDSLSVLIFKVLRCYSGPFYMSNFKMSGYHLCNHIPYNLCSNPLLCYLASFSLYLSGLSPELYT